MSNSFKHYLLLNLIVLIWGFTGVLGKEIDLQADKIVFFRMGIAFVSLLFLGFFSVKKTVLTTKQLFTLLLTGVIVGIHWYTFFYAIKISTVSVAVVCMSSTSLFTAFIEPLIFKRKLRLNEIILSCVIIIGIALIIGFEPNYIFGIIIGLISAFLAAFFGVLNGKYVQKITAMTITKYEMLGGFITLFIVLLLSGSINQDLFKIGIKNWSYLLILGIICTTAAFLFSVWLMKYLSPFTVSLGLNMEPIYAIIIVLIIDFLRGEKTEIMSLGFYLGTAIIIGSIFINGYLKSKK